MKPASTGSSAPAPSAPARLANARVALQRARAGRERALARQHAGEAEVKRLETSAEAIARALDAARNRAAADQPHSAAWSSVLAFAEADVAVAEKELALAEAKDRVARFRKEHPEGGDPREGATLEEALDRAEKAVESALADTGHKALGGEAARAERELEAIRKSEVERNRATLIGRRLAQLSAVSAKKAQERKGWSEREKSLGEEIAKLEGERKRLESERRQLTGRA